MLQPKRKLVVKTLTEKCKALRDSEQNFRYLELFEFSTRISNTFSRRTLFLIEQISIFQEHILFFDRTDANFPGGYPPSNLRFRSRWLLSTCYLEHSPMPNFFDGPLGVRDNERSSTVGRWFVSAS